jgi:hypothetical protein
MARLRTEYDEQRPAPLTERVYFKYEDLLFSLGTAFRFPMQSSIDIKSKRAICAYYCTVAHVGKYVINRSQALEPAEILLDLPCTEEKDGSLGTICIKEDSVIGFITVPTAIIKTNLVLLVAFLTVELGR